MKCRECGADALEKVKPEPYTTLDRVRITLHGGVERRLCGNCGEGEVLISAMGPLYFAVVRALIRKPTRLAGTEIVFLRKLLGFNSTDLARTLGVSLTTVSRWEHDTNPIDGGYDRALRLLGARFAQDDGEDLVEAFAAIRSTSGKVAPLGFDLDFAEKAWQVTRAEPETATGRVRVREAKAQKAKALGRKRARAAKR